MHNNQTKQLDDIEVMYVAVEGLPPQSAPKAFARLEKIVPLKGNKFYGVYNPKTNTYAACVKIKPEEHDPKTLGLPTWTIPGGLYAYDKLKGRYRDIIKQVKPAFDKLAENNEIDPNRPFIEFYRRFDEFVLYAPVK